MSFKVPTYDRSNVRELSGDTGGQTINIHREGTTGELLQTVGESAGRGIEMVQKARELYETTKAQNVYESAVTDIKREAANDPDVSKEKMQHYQDEIQSAAANSAKFITTPAQQEIFSLKHSAKADIDALRVEHMYSQKIVQAAKAQVEVEAKTAKEKFVAAALSGDGMGAQSAITDINDSLERQKGLMFSTDDQKKVIADKYFTNWKKEVGMAMVKSQPDRALKDIADGSFAKLGFTDAAQIAVLKVTAQKNVEALKRDAQKKAISEAIMLPPNVLTKDMLDTGLRAGIYPNGFVEKMEQNIKSPAAVGAETDNPVFNTLANKLAQSGSVDQTEKIFHEIIQANTHGKISKDARDYLYQMHVIAPEGKAADSYFDLKSVQDELKDKPNQDVEDLKKLQAAEDVAKKQHSDYIHSALTMLGNAGNAVSDFYKRITTKELGGPAITKEALDMKAENNLKLYPGQFSNVPKDGEDFVGANGQTYHKWPNGRIKNVKTGEEVG